VAGFLTDVFEVWRLASNYTSNCDDGVVSPGLRGAQDGKRNFKSARHADDGYIAILASRFLQAFHSAPHQPIHNFRIEPARHNGEMHSHRCGLTFHF
jgi:hypothetical protein